MDRVRAMLRWLTVEQYRRIDEQYLEPERRDYGMLWTLIAVIVAMILPRYFGRDKDFHALGPLETWLLELPYPTLYPAIYWAVFKLVNYFLVPLLVIKLVFRERLRDYGFKLTTDKRVLSLYLLMLAVVMPLVYVLSDSPQFLAKYPKYPEAAHSVFQLVVWEVGYALQFFLLEFFFRGFALYALARYVGHRAIFIMLVPYCMIHFAKPLLETLGSIITGIALGTLSLRTRSIYGGVVLHVAVGLSMDLFALWHKGELQKLFG